MTTDDKVLQPHAAVDDPPALLLYPLIWLLRNGQHPVEQLIQTLAPHVGAGVCVSAFDRWAAGNAEAAAQIDTDDRKQKGLEILVGAAIEQLVGARAGVAHGEGPKRTVRYDYTGPSSWATMAKDMDGAASAAYRAAIDLRARRQPHGDKELAECVAAAVEGRWGEPVKRLILEYLRPWVVPDADVPAPEPAAVEEPAPAQPLEQVADDDTDRKEREGVAPDADVPAEPQIDPEFSGQLDPLSEEEENQLEENLVADGACHSPLIVCEILAEGRAILIDGHHRLRLCKKHGIQFKIKKIKLPDREAVRSWIYRNHLGQRNDTPQQRAYYLGKLYEASKQSHGGPRQPSSRSDNSSTAAVLAAQWKTSAATVIRNAEYAAGIDKIAESNGEEAKQSILSGKSGLSREDVKDIAAKEPGERQQAVEEARARSPRARSKGEKPKAPKPVKDARTIEPPKNPHALARWFVNKVGREKALPAYGPLGKLLGVENNH
jgi:hypothetical protein